MVALQTLAQHRGDVFVELRVFVVYPRLYHHTRYLVLLIVEGYHLTAFLRHTEVDVGQVRDVLGHGKLLCYLAKSTVYLLVGLFVGFHYYGFLRFSLFHFF